jgi:hypothetical protein
MNILVNSRFDQKAKVGSTWIDGPTLNFRNRHQEVILDVPQHYRCMLTHFIYEFYPSHSLEKGLKHNQITLLGFILTISTSYVNL